MSLDTILTIYGFGCPVAFLIVGWRTSDDFAAATGNGESPLEGLALMLLPALIGALFWPIILVFKICSIIYNFFDKHINFENWVP